MTEAQTMLEPCPFCGSIPKNTEYFGNYNKPSYVVHCESCDISLNGDNTPEQAAARWNTRATAAAQPVAALADKMDALQKDFGSLPYWIVAQHLKEFSESLRAIAAAPPPPPAGDTGADK